jgi:epoxyqueuosine reductase
MGNRIYGCDDCLAVCPWNKFAKPAVDPSLLARGDLKGPALRELALLEDATFRTRFSGSPIKRIGRNRFVRNVMIAIGNSEDLSLLPVATQLQADDDPVVAEAAAWARHKLEGRTSAS